MTLRLEDKKVIVTELKQIANESVAAVAADYRGLTVSDMDQLRVDSRKAGVVVRVSRNTLVRKAIEGTNFACLDSALKGPIVLLFSQEDPGACARVLKDYVKKHEAMDVMALVVDGNLLPADQLTTVASLPTYDQAIGQLMSVMIAPVTKAVRTVNETVAQAVRVIAAVADKKKAA
jgi:large subunit ribosomal protein L10